MRKIFLLIILLLSVVSCGATSNSSSSESSSEYVESSSVIESSSTVESSSVIESAFEDYGMPVIDVYLSDTPIVEDGLYTSMSEVGAYLYTYHRLPSNFKVKSQFKKANVTAENKLSTGGDTFQNREGLLPKLAGRTYYECDIDYTGGNRNAKRIVYSSDTLIFYTSDHYASFSILRFYE